MNLATTLLSLLGINSAKEVTSSSKKDSQECTCDASIMGHGYNTADSIESFERDPETGFIKEYPSDFSSSQPQALFDKIMNFFTNMFQFMAGNNAVEGNNNRSNSGIYGNQAGDNNTQGNSGDVNGKVTDNSGQVGNGNIMDSHDMEIVINNTIIKKCDCDGDCKKNEDVELTPEFNDKFAEYENTINDMHHQGRLEASKQHPELPFHSPEIGELGQEISASRIEEFKAANPDCVKFKERLEEERAAMKEAIANGMDEETYLKENPACKEYLDFYSEAALKFTY